MRTVFIVAHNLELAMRTAAAIDLEGHRWTYLNHRKQLLGRTNPIVVMGPGANRRTNWEELSKEAVQQEATILLMLQLNGDRL